MGADSLSLRFETNPKRDGVIAFLQDGTPVFVDRESPQAVEPGQTWMCRVERRGHVGFAVPLARLELPNQQKGLNWNEVREAEERVRAELEKRLATLLESLRSELQSVRARLDALEKKAPEGEPPPGEAAPSIEQRIVQQLYARGCWGRRVHSGEHFFHGLLSTVEGPRVRAVLDDLAQRGLLLADGKGADARYSLNPAMSGPIHRLLGLREPGGATKTEPPGPSAEAPPRRRTEFVERGDLENALRSLREQVDSVRRELAAGAGRSTGQPPLERLERRLAELEGRAGGADSRFNKLSARLDALESRPPSTSRRRRPDESARESPLVELLKDGPAATPGIPRPEHASTLAASLGGGETLAKAVDFLRRTHRAGFYVGPPAPFFRIGAFGRCSAAGCGEAAAGFAPLIDVTYPGEPQVLPALVCAEHEATPPPLAWVEGGLNRKSAEEAVQAFAEAAERLGLPEPPSLSTLHVQFVGPEPARRMWNLAARRLGNR